MFACNGHESHPKSISTWRKCSWDGFQIKSDTDLDEATTEDG